MKDKEIREDQEQHMYKQNKGKSERLLESGSQKDGIRE